MTDSTKSQAQEEEGNKGIIDDIINSPSDLTSEVFSKLLEQKYGAPQAVKSLKMHRLSHSILSNVMEINLDIDGSSNIPKIWIGKFQRPTFPIPHMFSVEGNFYKRYASREYPFLVPTLLFCGTQCILLAKVESVKSYSLLDSCPSDRLELTVGTLARMHAIGWNEGDYNDLAPVPGIGSSLSGLDKQRLFPKTWRTFMDNLPEGIVLSTLKCVCETLEDRRLEEIHVKVNAFKPTLIHGDYHVGNFLYSSERIWVLDWATCGAGNPLLDMCFFYLVSTRITVKDFFGKWLPFYYKLLITSCPDKNIQDELSWHMCVDMAKICLVNQFLILVCYDEMSRDLLVQQVDSRTVQEFYSQHFENVNRRTVEAILSPEVSVLEMDLPPVKSVVEIEQEEHAETKTPMSL